jgi:hypothetical protein
LLSGNARHPPSPSAYNQKTTQIPNFFVVFALFVVNPTVLLPKSRLLAPHLPQFEGQSPRLPVASGHWQNPLRHKIRIT